MPIYRNLVRIKFVFKLNCIYAHIFSIDIKLFFKTYYLVSGYFDDDIFHHVRALMLTH